MKQTDDDKVEIAPHCIAVTGMSGAGRNTALNVFEDCGFHRIDNLPPDLLERIFIAPMDSRPLALGFGAFSGDEYAKLELALKKISKDVPIEILFIDANDDVLRSRFNETRRKHPSADGNILIDGIHAEREKLKGLREMSNVRIDSSGLSPHDLKRELRRIFDLENDVEFHIQVKSFSYKKGVPKDADLVFDCRFLKNPHWDETLRPLDGRNEDVAKYVETDPVYFLYAEDIERMLGYILPAAQEEGRSYFTICFGCSGGRHRSVALAERLHALLSNEGWKSHILHRELATISEIKV